MGSVLKIVIVIGGVVLAVFIGATLFFRHVLAQNSKERKPAEQVYNGEGEENALILYQPSPHGTTDTMAMAAAEALQELGYTVVVNHPSRWLDYDLSDYQALGFGSAVYMGTVSGPLLDYMRSHPFTGKRVFLFSAGSDLRQKPELDRMESAVPPGNMVSKVKVKRGEEELIKGILREQFAGGVSAGAGPLEAEAAQEESLE